MRAPAPTITAPPGVVSSCVNATDLSPNVTGQPTVNSSCGGAVVVNYTDTVNAHPQCTPRMNITRTWTVTGTTISLSFYLCN